MEKNQTYDLLHAKCTLHCWVLESVAVIRNILSCFYDTQKHCSRPVLEHSVILQFTESQTVPVQTRIRYIVQEPKYGGARCPIRLSEVRHCNNSTQCENFFWHVGPWSPCALPPDRIMQCGKGLQARGKCGTWASLNFTGTTKCRRKMNQWKEN